MKDATPPVIVSVIVLLGFAGFSFLAMKPELAGVKESVVLFLLGAWSTLAAGVVNYWVGSSSSSKQKDETIQTMSNTANKT
jgi:hypothetical protein